ncbi:MAG TPA: diguanylate cyclase, partial [Micromonosporaceae bacterium]|nr:diguanylate cyclase [Micromonosporaceae bacterium]
PQAKTSPPDAPAQPAGTAHAAGPPSPAAPVSGGPTGPVPNRPAPKLPTPAGRPELQVLTECDELRRRIQVLVDDAPNMIIVYALHDGGIRYANEAAGILLGRPPDQILGANVFDVITVPEHRAADPTEPQPEEPGLFPGEYSANLPDGSIRYLDVRGAPVILDGIRCGQLVGWDVTTRVERERDLFRRASYDELTGLPNAAHAFVYLEQSLRRLERSGTGCVAVILIDLDGFKQVNDTYGHQLGDALLQYTATRIRSATRDTDLAARLHGDEFLVVQSVANPIHAAYVSDRLRTALAKPIDIDGLTVKVSASVGVAVAEPGSTDPHHLLQFADHRMYTDKQRRSQQR